MTKKEFEENKKQLMQLGEKIYLEGTHWEMEEKLTEKINQLFPNDSILKNSVVLYYYSLREIFFCRLNFLNAFDNYFYQNIESPTKKD